MTNALKVLTDYISELTEKCIFIKYNKAIDKKSFLKNNSVRWAQGTNVCLRNPKLTSKINKKKKKNQQKASFSPETAIQISN